MANQNDFITYLKPHKRWADAASIVSIVLVIGLLAAVALLADSSKADEPTRIGMYFGVVGTIIVVCIWQAAGFVAAANERALRRHVFGVRPD